MREPYFSIVEFFGSLTAYGLAILASIGLVVAADWMVNLFS